MTYKWYVVIRCVNLTHYPKYDLNPFNSVGHLLVGCFGLNGLLRQYFSLYPAVTQREGERREMIDERKNVQLKPWGGRVVRWSWVNFQCRGVLLVWIRVGQGPTALAVGAGGGCLDIFTLVYPFSADDPI